MKLRTLLAPLSAVLLLAACGADTPTGIRAPERAAFNGGSFGPGHITGGAGEELASDSRGGSYGSGHRDEGTSEVLSTDSPPSDTTTDARGGSLGSGH